MPDIDMIEFDSPVNPILYVTLSYPRVEGNTNTIRIELGDVRAADDLIIRYDFDRDGWSISRDIVNEDQHRVAEDQEVAFIPAWTVQPALSSRADEQHHTTKAP